MNLPAVFAGVFLIFADFRGYFFGHPSFGELDALLFMLGVYLSCFLTSEFAILKEHLSRIRSACSRISPRKNLPALFLIFLSFYGTFGLHAGNVRFGLFDLYALSIGIFLLFSSSVPGFFMGLRHPMNMLDLAVFCSFFSVLLHLSLEISVFALPINFVTFLTLLAALPPAFCVFACRNELFVNRNMEPLFAFSFSLVLFLLQILFFLSKDVLVYLFFSYLAYARFLAVSRDHPGFSFFSYLKRPVSVPKPLYALLFFSLLALFVRFWGIGGNFSVLNTFPEGYFSYGAYLVYSGLMPIRDFYFTHIFLYPHVLSFFYNVFTPSIFTARAVNAVLNFLAIPLVYLIGSRFYGRQAGLVAAFFYGFSLYTVKMARIVEVENLQVFFICLSVYFLFRDKSTISAPNSILAGLFLGLASLAKEPSALMAIPFIFAILHFNRLGSGLALFASYLSVLLPVSLYLFLFAYDGLSNLFYFHLLKDTYSFGERFAFLFFDGIGTNPLLFALFCTGVFCSLKRRSFEDKFVLLWFLSFLSLMAYTNYFWHYSLALFPAMVIIAANGLRWLSMSFSGREMTYFSVAVLFAFLLLQSGSFIALLAYHSDDLLGISEAVRNNTAPQDRIISSNLMVPFLAGRQVPPKLFEIGFQNRLMGSEGAIFVAEAENVSCVVIDRRFTDPRADNLVDFVAYVKRTYSPVAFFQAGELNTTIYCR